MKQEGRPPKIAFAEPRESGIRGLHHKLETAGTTIDQCTIVHPNTPTR